MMNKIITGNCFVIINDVINSVKNPVIVTDPPFNIGYHYEGYKDKLPEDTYYKNLSELGKKCPSVFIHYPEAICKLSIAMNEAPERIISWVYPSNTARQHRDIAFYRIKPKFENVRQPYKNPTDKRVSELQKKTGGAKMYDWIEMNQIKNVSKEKTSHPCQMPLELMRKIIKLLPKDSTVIDPFCGSGTTLLACKLENIPYVGIEINVNYADIARERLDKTCISQS